MLDLFQLENKRIELIKNLNRLSSTQRKFFSIYNFYQLILSISNHSISYAFIPEFLELFVHLLGKIEPNYLHPRLSKKIIAQIQIIQELDFSSDLTLINEQLLNSKESFVQKFNLFEKHLSGISTTSNNQKIKFPILDEIKTDDKIIHGFLESVSVSIKKSNLKDNFIIIPSGMNTEERLENQIKICWNIALDYVKSFIKNPSKFHQVIIAFDKKAGMYSGDSLGINLTIAFIEQLLIYYNSEINIFLNPGVTLTGGVTETNKINSVSDDIVRKKTEIVFFSYSDIFVVPKQDELAAQAKLDELNKEFPNRKMTIIGIETLEDLFNRRNIVDIKKISVIKKTTNKLKRNWKTVAIIGILLFVIGFFLYQNWDDNPNQISTDGSTIYIKNKSGKTLWDFKAFASQSDVRASFYKQKTKIVDINNDGYNEVIFCDYTINSDNNDSSKNTISCCDKNKNILWKYKFEDNIKSIDGYINNRYGSYNIIDTVTINGEKSIMLFSSSLQSFSSAIYRLNILNGKRLPGTFWASGHILDGEIKDLDKDRKPEVVGVGYDNGYEDLCFFVYTLDTLTTVRPTTEKYLIRNYPICNLKSYMRFPKNDFDIYWGLRTPTFNIGSFYEENKKFVFASAIKTYNDVPAVGYEIDYNLKDINIVINSNFRVQRDSLVVHSKLKPPLTDTEEYCNILLSQIKYWNGKEFVCRKELN